MKQEYLIPEVEIVAFPLADVIATSWYILETSLDFEEYFGEESVQY